MRNGDEFKRDSKGYYFRTVSTSKKSIRRIASMCNRVYQRSITKTHRARKYDRIHGEVWWCTIGRSGRKSFATNIKVEVTGRIIWVSE